MRINRLFLGLCALSCLAVAVLTFVDTNSAFAAGKIAPKHLVSNLENPSGIAIHGPTGHIFIASRYGVYRYDPASHKVHLEISGYPTGSYGKGTYETSTKFDIGPLGLAFLDDNHLVVGDGSRKDGAELVRVYKIDGEKGGKAHEPYKEAAAAYTLGPIKPGEESIKGEGNFYGVAVGAGAIFVTSNGDDTKGWLVRAEIKDGQPGELKPYLATKVATNVDAPVAITFSVDGKDLVVGQMGEMNVPGDSLLTIYNPADKKLKLNAKTGLSDIAGLAYSPKTKKLYATDFSWSDQKKGGLFELTVKGDTVKATKIIDLDKPTAIAFDKDGKLYLTTFGTKAANDKSDKSPGGLYVIDAGL